MVSGRLKSFYLLQPLFQTAQISGMRMMIECKRPLP